MISGNISACRINKNIFVYKKKWLLSVLNSYRNGLHLKFSYGMSRCPIPFYSYTFARNNNSHYNM